MNGLLQDVCYALRGLRRTPSFTLFAVLTLALGIGGTGAMVAVGYGVLLRPLPFPDQDRLVGLWEIHPGANAPLKNDLLSRPTYRTWAQQSTTLDAIAAYAAKDYVLAHQSTIERVPGVAVTTSFFQVLESSPLKGRLFIASDGDPGSSPVAVITDTLWRERFAADPAAIGRILTLDDIEHVIVGIVSAEFSFPSRDIRVYTPLSVPTADPRGGAVGILTAIGRLKRFVSVTRAEAEGTAIARAVDRPFADLVYGEGEAVQVRVQPLVDQQTSGVRSALVVLSVGVALLLLVACANFANLLLARGTGRIREFAIRTSLGAGKVELLRQIITESLVLSAIGGLIGMCLGWAVMVALPAVTPTAFPRVDQIRIDLWFLSAVALTAFACGVLSGVWPVMRTLRDLSGAAQVAGLRGGIVSGGHMGPTLVVVESALAVVLLVGATLLGRSFVALLQVDAGYQPAGVLTADVSVVSGSDRQRKMAQLADALVERLQAAPGVQAIGLGSMAPFGSVLNSAGFALPGIVTPEGQPVIARAFQAIVTPGYAEALGLRLKAGRFFVATDTASPSIAMIVNETFATTYLADGKPTIGRLFRGMFPRMLGRNDAVVTIVGVVEDVLPDRLDGRPQPQIYLPMGVGFSMGSGATLVVRTVGDPILLAPTVRGAVQEIESGAALAHVGSLTAKRLESASESRFATFIMGAFGILALALSMTGLYGVLSYNIAQRTRELGVRGALGATKADLHYLVLRQGLVMTGVGIAIGTGGAMLATRGMVNLLFGVSALDPVAYAVPALLLIVVAIAACVIPLGGHPNPAINRHFKTAIN